ncbi:hypothetical protein PCYB_007210, partial [Plasmodium cynomolgi strain B]
IGRKELFEYYVDNDGIISTAKFYKTGCNDYYKYVKYKERLYYYIMNLFSISYNVGYPNFFVKCKEYHPENVLPEIICYHDMKKRKISKHKLMHKIKHKHKNSTLTPSPNMYYRNS